LRDERKADLERHVKEVNALMSGNSLVPIRDDSDASDVEAEEWNGIEEAEPEPIDHEAEYIDEDKYTTVTVEEVDISRDGMSKLRGSEDEDQGDEGRTPSGEPTKPSDSKKPPAKKDKDKRPKKKKKAFRYESPADRKMNRVKERARKTKAARARRGDD